MHQPGSDWCACAQLDPYTLMRACNVVKGLQEDDAPAPLLPVCADAPAFADQRSQGMTPRQVASRHHTRAARQPERHKARGAAPHTLGQRVETTVDLLLHALRLHQVGMGCDHRGAGASALASPRTLRALRRARHQGRHVPTEAIAEKPRDTRHHRTIFGGLTFFKILTGEHRELHLQSIKHWEVQKSQ